MPCVFTRFVVYIMWTWCVCVCVCVFVCVCVCACVCACVCVSVWLWRQQEQANPAGVMVSYNELNGVPNAVNAALMTTLLRDTWQSKACVSHNHTQPLTRSHTHHTHAVLPRPR